MNDFKFGVCPICGEEFDEYDSHICDDCREKYVNPSSLDDYKLIDEINAQKEKGKNGADLINYLLMNHLYLAKDYFNRLEMDDETWIYSFYQMLAIALEAGMDMDGLGPTLKRIAKFYNSVLPFTDEDVDSIMEEDFEENKKTFAEVFKQSSKEDFYGIAASLCILIAKTFDLSRDNYPILDWPISLLNACEG